MRQVHVRKKFTFYSQGVSDGYESFQYYVVAVLPLFGVENGRPDTWKGFLHCQILKIKVYRKIHEECILTYRPRVLFYCVSHLRKSQNYYNTLFFLVRHSIFNFYIHVYMFMRRISIFDELYVPQFRKPKTNRGGKKRKLSRMIWNGRNSEVDCVPQQGLSDQLWCLIQVCFACCPASFLSEHGVVFLITTVWTAT